MLLFIREKIHEAVHRFERDDKFPFWTLGYFRAGRCRFWSSQGETLHTEPVFLLTPPHTPYLFEAYCSPSASYHEVFAFFSPPAHLLPLLRWPDYTLSLRGDDAALLKRATRRFREAAALFAPPYRPHHRQWAWNALEETLLMLDALRAEPQDRPRDSRIERTLEFIIRHYQRAMDVDELAKVAGLSPSHFAHLFRDEMGVTPMQHLECFRLDRAMELLLSTNGTVAEIAENVGFENASHFTLRFRKRFKMPPGRLRNRPSVSLVFK